MVINVLIFNQNRKTSDFQNTENTKQDSLGEYWSLSCYFISYIIISCIIISCIIISYII